MIRRIAAYSLFILGFLTVTFFRHYTGDIIPYPSLFWLLGLAMFLGGYLLIRYTPTVKEQAVLQQLRQMIEELKANGEKIRVPFIDCEIRENNYQERKEAYGSDSLMLSMGMAPELHYRLNKLEGKTDRTEHVYQSVIVFSYHNQRTGKTEKFISRVIPRDRVSLSVQLDNQQHTSLYVDKNNRARYYFDLTFLL